MRSDPAANSSANGSFDAARANGTDPLRDGWNKPLRPITEILRSALTISGRKLQVALQRIDELRGRDSRLEQEVARLESEVARAYQFAYHDELTGLPNRRLLQDRFSQVVARGIRHHEHVVLLFIDLDGFKRINDKLGHRVGDCVLQQLGTRLTACIRASDTVCRYGGDEFVVLLPEIQSLDQAVAVMEKIRCQLALPYDVGGSTVSSAASIGMAVFPVDGCELCELIDAADRDMYQHKSRDSIPTRRPGISA